MSEEQKNLGAVSANEVGPVRHERPARHEIVNQVNRLCELFDRNLLIAEQQDAQLREWRSVSAPAPRSDDVCVSPEKAPDYAPAQFTGGVTNITLRSGCLIFHFANGGQIHVSNPVVYMAPETH
jgi:hypothetical protein